MEIGSLELPHFSSGILESDKAVERMHKELSRESARLSPEPAIFIHSYNISLQWNATR